MLGDIENLVPQKVRLKFSNYGREFKLRPISVLDDLWMSKFLKNAESVELLDVEKLAAIAYHQMVKEDQKHLASQDVEYYDDSGNCAIHKAGGKDLILSLMTGEDDIVSLSDAVTECIRISRPEVVDHAKKKAKEMMNQ